MGDFKSVENENKIREGAWNMRISLKWYKSIIEKIVNINKDINVYIFSDATNKELKEILDVYNVKRCYFGSAISDLLALSRGKVLVASASTFSMWASFLGQNHTIWFPGQKKFKIIQNKNIFEGELDYSDSLPKNIINYVSK
ncbi:MAG: hypothetical protein CMP58_01375 [Flavobacteriales bacterium]|nr:hypothetical protein [Flavobacteriales bacterium]